MTDLISREAAIAALRAASARPSSIAEIEALPAIKPRVAVGLDGGCAQWALADNPNVRVHIVDFDLDTFDEGYDYRLVRDTDGCLNPANAYEEGVAVNPGYFVNLDLAPVCAGDGTLETAEPDPAKIHILTDVLQCGPDGVHELHDGYYEGSREQALQQHEEELRFFFGEYKTGPRGQQVIVPDV